MKFDDIIPLLGESGRYQLRLLYFVSVVGFFCGIEILIAVFFFSIPQHRCAVPGLENDTYAIQGEGHEAMVNMSIPWEKTPGSEGKWKRSSCQVHEDAVTNGSAWTVSPGGHLANSSSLVCERFVYDKSEFDSTVMTEWDLVCGQEHLRSHGNMLVMGGMLVGALGLGTLSDFIGRKKVLLLSVFIHVASALGTALGPNYATVVIFHFGSGAANQGLFLSAFVLGMELVGPRKRAMAGMVIHYYWCLGLFVLAGVAYGLRGWRMLGVSLAVPSVLIFSLYWLIPESPRWLLSRGRKEEAWKILQQAAKVNGVKLPEGLPERSQLKEEKHGKVWEMFTHPKLCVRTLVIFFNWFVVSMVYFGLGLNVGSLAGNVYLNFTIASGVETLAYVLCQALLDRAGRKSLHCLAMCLSGLACLGSIFPVLYGGQALQWVTVLLSMVGKLGASAGFALIYILSAELFPTVLRQSGIGASSTCARVGSMVSPYIADLSHLVKSSFAPALPLVVFGVLAVAAGLLTCLLPETLNRKLPETVEEAKHFGLKGGEKREIDVTVPNEEEMKSNGQVNGELNKGFDIYDEMTYL